MTLNAQFLYNHIGGIMVSVLAQSVVDRGFESGSEKLSIQGHTTLKQSFILIYQASEEKRFKYAGYNLTLIIYNNLLKLYWKINDYMVNSDNIN
jgi:hypothetical protein